MVGNCKYYFQIILKKFPEICRNLRAGLVDSEQKPFLGPWDPAVIWLRFHQYDIRAYLADAVPGDVVIALAADHPQKAAWPRHHDGTDLSLRHLHQYIADKAQPSSVADADDFLALQLGKFHRHIPGSSHTVLVKDMPVQRWLER